MMPPGSLPGMTSFACAPTARPNRIQPRMPISASMVGARHAVPLQLPGIAKEGPAVRERQGHGALCPYGRPRVRMFGVLFELRDSIVLPRLRGSRIDADLV